MGIFWRSIRAQRQRSTRAVRPRPEGLENRLTLTVSEAAPVNVALPPSVIVKPAFQREPATSTTYVTFQSSRSVAGAENFSASTPSGFTPAQIRGAYGINKVTFGSVQGDGTGQTVAIVDAYDDPRFVDSSAPGFSSSDLARFDQQFGLPDPPSFIKLNQYGSLTNLPGTDPAGPGNPQGNWEVEEALDVEWAHAIAPGANIILVECNSSSGSDMYRGVVTAANLGGVSVVSMSWGSGEFSSERNFDGDFTTPAGHQGVTFVASTGDAGSPGEYPAYSPTVVAAGGTTLFLNTNGSYNNETGWSGSGGGISSFEPTPTYQASLQNTGHRTIPDVSFVANPNTGVAVYDSYNGTTTSPWEQIGGTSLSAPCLAAMIAIANQGRTTSGCATLDGTSQTLPALYSASSSDFNDITSGSNGSFKAGVGYDEVTGLGTPRVNLLVPDLVAWGMSAKLVITSEPLNTVTAGSSFGLSVAVEGLNGDVATDFNGSMTVALASNPAGGPLTGSLTVMARNGIATFSGLVLTRAATGYSLCVTATGTAAAATSTFDVLPAAATHLMVISGPPLRVGVRSPFGITVAVEDPYGNLVTSYSGSVTVARASGPGNSILGGTLKVIVNQGVATFSNLTLNQIGIGYSLQATSSSGLKAAKTTLFSVVGNVSSAVPGPARLMHIAAVLKSHNAQGLIRAAGWGALVTRARLAQGKSAR
jgi:subtilase family serine protease